jgi:hypothetical protein
MGVGTPYRKAVMVDAASIAEHIDRRRCHVRPAAVRP